MDEREFMAGGVNLHAKRKLAPAHVNIRRFGRLEGIRPALAALAITWLTLGRQGAASGDIPKEPA